MSTTTRCKFTCTNREEIGDGTRSFTFFAVTDDKCEENAQYWAATPSGQLNFQCLNQNVDFEVGKSYYLDIREAEAAE